MCDTGSFSIFGLLKITRIPAFKAVTVFVVAGCIHSKAVADADDGLTTNSWTAQNARFGLFDGLDHRSIYYTDSFPQPLLVDDTGIEPEPEVELNYFHTAAADQERTDMGSVELQKSFGVVTFELEAPYEHFSDSDDTAQGFGNIELSARVPLYQYVSDNGVFDTTAGVGMEAGIPVNSEVSKNTELEPAAFNDLGIGRHFTVQTVLGYDKLLGGGDDGGSAEFEYGLAFAWTMPHEELPLPGVERFSPLFEVSGELGLNEDEAGQNSVLGSAGFRVDFRAVGGVEPSLGLGYLFPMSSAGRDEVHWGIVANFTMEF